MDLTVSEAAQSLGVTPRRVRALIERGQLPARRQGPLWLTTTDAVATYRRTAPGRGRPQSPHTAWARLRAIAEATAPPAAPETLPALRARATARRLALPDLLARRLRTTPPPGAFVAGAELAGTTASDGVIDLYAPEPVASRLVARLRLEDDPAGALVLHAVSSPALPSLSERERLALAWCDLADRADPAADVAAEALWPGSLDVPALADVRATGRVPYTALRAVVDWTARHPHMAWRAIQAPPGTTGNRGIDSLIAGIAETIADDRGVERPVWTARIRPAPLDEPGTVDAGDDRWREVPAPLAARGLGFPRETFWRER